MLKQLHISNYALIDELDVSFDRGFNVITGETGAGKSILLGALAFAMGERADTGVLYDKEKKCVVEAQFELDDDKLRPLFEENDLDFETECLFRRELSPQKKSRAFINDTPVALQTMKEIGDLLVDIHSQHDSLLLTDADFQLSLLDEIAQNEAVLTDYQAEYGKYNAYKRKLNELKDIAYDLRRKADETQFDEGQLQSLQERYDLLSRLMMKHHVADFEALIALRDSLKEKVNAFENIDEAIAKAQQQLDESIRLLTQKAKALHDKRCKAATAFGEKVSVLVRQLAMPFAVFQVEVQSQEGFGSKGSDVVRFLFSANKGIAVDDIRRVASGGELSRLMLSIKSAVSDYNYIPTLIFDEIDTGVSGEVAAKIGGIMRQMGQSLQLISITHLPQVASQAEHHYFIYKDNEGERTQSHIRLLDSAERIGEIAKMLSNDKVTPEALKAAEVLLKN